MHNVSKDEYILKQFSLIFTTHTSYNGDGLMLENIYGNTQSTESANLISFQLNFDFF